LAGGAAPRVVLEKPDIHTYQWMAGSDSLVALVRGLKDGDLWHVPLTGTIRKLDIDAQSWIEFRVSPDGRQVAAAAQVGDTGDQVWALENFLPASSRNR